MKKLTVSQAIHHQQFKSLLEHRDMPALSVYLPASNPSVVKQLFVEAQREAEAQLDTYGLHPLEMQELLVPLQELTQQPDFWNQAVQGLAVYVSADDSWTYFQAVTPDLRVIADDYFYVIPLITHYLNHKNFYVLNLSQDQLSQNENQLQARLYAASQLEITEIPLLSAELNGPDNLAELARELSGFLHIRVSPILIVCPQQSTYRQLCELFLANGLKLECHYAELNTVSLPELHQQAWQQLAPVLRFEQAEALRDYQTLQDSTKILHDVMAVVQAAYNSRVAKLFLVTRPPQPSSRSQRVEDMLNRAAIYTYLNGGEVYTVQAEELSGTEQAAAILRY